MECKGKSESDVKRGKCENRKAKSKGPIDGKEKATFYRSIPEKERACAEHRMYL